MLTQRLVKEIDFEMESPQQWQGVPPKRSVQYQGPYILFCCQTVTNQQGSLAGPLPTFRHRVRLEQRQAHLRTRFCHVTGGRACSCHPSTSPQCLLRMTKADTKGRETETHFPHRVQKKISTS